VGGMSGGDRWVGGRRGEVGGREGEILGQRRG
jgi:hypothetical protein